MHSSAQKPEIFRVIASANESFHGVAPLGSVIAAFPSQEAAEAFADEAKGAAPFIVVARGGEALYEVAAQ